MENEATYAAAAAARQSRLILLVSALLMWLTHHSWLHIFYETFVMDAAAPMDPRENSSYSVAEVECD